MAKSYEMNGFRRAVNRVTGFLARRGKGPASELTTIGRKSGKARTVPVTPIEVGGVRYLVSPYGAVGWVHNIRAAGMATLSRAGTSEQISVAEVQGDDAAVVLKEYVAEVKIVRPFFDVPPDAAVADFAAEADAHPVFRIER
ncbi:hypothetical protein BMS3Abin02_00415 [bacterium BMS3Abin02]|nr:hypothetical protein BMS3Abin02_00415 [bacterium BMS3Abin02]GBE23372.1 hypothetical protein BMS3Bbin01_02756 [bacterium BMS3Bbin01]HDH27476.1 nitroreductase family deazaflavin-dependent oxidoreductase [Actinomycetota bacterium]